MPGPGQENLRDGYPRYGYWTASPINKSGTFGLGITEDGTNWKALPSPKMLRTCFYLGPFFGHVFTKNRFILGEFG